MLVVAQILQSETGFEIISVVVTHSLGVVFVTQTPVWLQVAQQSIYTGVGVNLWTRQYSVQQWAPNGVEQQNKTSRRCPVLVYEKRVVVLHFWLCLVGVGYFRQLLVT